MNKPSATGQHHSSDASQQPLGPAESAVQIQKLHPAWQICADGREIARQFHCTDYYQTIAFANAVAWIASSENHHPQLTIRYKTCEVRYTTHTLGGLSAKDFLCAARIDALVA